MQLLLCHREQDEDLGRAWAAFDEVVLGNRLHFTGFEDAQNHQVSLNPDGLIWDY